MCIYSSVFDFVFSFLALVARSAYGLRIAPAFPPESFAALTFPAIIGRLISPNRFMFFCAVRGFVKSSDIYIFAF